MFKRKQTPAELAHSLISKPSSPSADVPLEGEKAPDQPPTIHVEVGPRERAASWRWGRTAWRWAWNLIDLALLVAVIGVIIWALGQLALRHYLPGNTLTKDLISAAQWESQVVMQFAGPKK